MAAKMEKIRREVEIRASGELAENVVTILLRSLGSYEGINAIREIFANCPFAATEELLRDLAEYRTYENKNVSMAARALITLFRAVNHRSLLAKTAVDPPTVERRKNPSLLWNLQFPNLSPMRILWRNTEKVGAKWKLMLVVVIVA
ncbi:unnamed protein product [Cylicocyclus nassatus]|uniref:Protein SDA1 n=1 Tax=Cylicocyclus nassatus TaxID=53992 RepID=A0AA36M6S3_CYLNA|nr:unnamed protein product [Cylicocyclus nassatus]